MILMPKLYRGFQAYTKESFKDICLFFVLPHLKIHFYIAKCKMQTITSFLKIGLWRHKVILR